MAQTSAPVRRPRDRRQQIIASAARQFRTSGYHNVGITEIAEAVGITSAALYRHFGGKQDLLVATIEDAIDRLTTVWSRSDAGLDELLDASCALTIADPELGVLWARELTHLPPETQRELRARLLRAVEPVRSALATARPDLSADAVDLLLWAALAVVSGARSGAVKIGTARLQATLLRACRAVCHISPVATVDHSTTDGSRTRTQPAKLLPSSRQEAILTAATRLFSARGYQAVGIDDIGAAAGITGATVYHHFANKSAILAATLNRCLHAMFFELSGALDSSATPGEALDKVLASFARLCTTQGHVIAALQSEVINLPEDERRPLLHVESDYVAEWVALLTQHRPELSEGEAQVLVRATMWAFGSLLAIPHILARPTLADELMAIGRAILGLEASRPGI